MKTIYLLIATIMGLSFANQSKAQENLKGKKILVVYYSYSGNTKELANKIKDATGADIFEIVPRNDYPKGYQDVVDQAKKEIEAKHKPVLKNKPENIDSYEIIIVGSPNWWSTIAPPVATFLTSYNFKGKTIIPFITHEGSRMGKSSSDIKELCPDATVLEGLPVRGGSVKNADKDVQAWLEKLGLN